MKIIPASTHHLEEIIEVNKFIDYGNPDCYIHDSIKNGLVFVAIDDGKVIGFSLYQVVWGNTPLLALVKVHPNYQGKGIGTKLVEATEKKLKKEGFHSYTSSTEEKNSYSQKFHNKL